MPSVRNQFVLTIAWGAALAVCAGCPAPYPPVSHYELAQRILDPSYHAPDKYTPATESGTSPRPTPKNEPEELPRPRSHRPTTPIELSSTEDRLADVSQVQAHPAEDRTINPATSPADTNEKSPSEGSDELTLAAAIDLA